MAAETYLDRAGSRFAVSDRRTTTGGARQLRAQVHQALQNGDRHLVVDCESWNEFDLGTLSSLIQCATVCREAGASFEVANMSHGIRESVRDLQLARRLGIDD